MNSNLLMKHPAPWRVANGDRIVDANGVEVPGTEHLSFIAECANQHAAVIELVDADLEFDEANAEDLKAESDADYYPVESLARVHYAKKRLMKAVARRGAAIEDVAEAFDMRNQAAVSAGDVVTVPEGYGTVWSGKVGRVASIGPLSCHVDVPSPVPGSADRVRVLLADIATEFTD